MSWRPILEGNDAQRARRAIADVIDAIREPNWEDLSLARGEAGIAVVLAYAARALDDPALHALAVERISGVAERGAEVPDLTLWMGLPVVAWAIEQVSKVLEVEAEDEDPHAEVDAAILALLADPRSLPFELLTGICGLAVYAFERLPRQSAVRIVEEVVLRLERPCERTPAGATWLTPPELLPPPIARMYPRGYHSLGIAHGAPGAVAILGAACAHEIAVPTARPLLAEAIRWIWAQRLPETARQRFSALAESRVPAEHAGWCYGDPAIASVLHAAGVPEAIELGLDVTSRPTNACGIEDPMLCHGAAGLAHMLNRFYQLTGDARFADAARRWFRDTLDRFVPGTGVGGFTALDMDGDAVVEVKYRGLLAGSAGVAAALVAAITPVEPRWDRAFALALGPA